MHAVPNLDRQSLDLVAKKFIRELVKPLSFNQKRHKFSYIVERFKFHITDNLEPLLRSLTLFFPRAVHNRLRTHLIGSGRWWVVGSEFIGVCMEYGMYLLKLIRSSKRCRILCAMWSDAGKKGSFMFRKGSNFLSNLFKAVCKILKTRKINTSPYHPQYNANNIIGKKTSNLFLFLWLLDVTVANNEKLSVETTGKVSAIVDCGGDANEISINDVQLCSCGFYPSLLGQQIPNKWQPL